MKTVDLRDTLKFWDMVPKFFEDDMELKTMRVEEFMEAGKLVIKAEMPGIDVDKDVKITVSDGRLRIQAERQERTEDKQKDSYRSEFHYGSFVREMALPHGVKPADVTAAYKDGVLRIEVPMPEEAEAETTVPVVRS